MSYAKQITIVAMGDTENDVNLAIVEAQRQIAEGCVIGHNRNDTGAFRFEVTDRPLIRDLPA